MGLVNFALSLAQADTEQEVVSILVAEEGYWDDPAAWRYYGDKENNFADIGNQQSLPEAAMVEKLTNSVDAVLMRECLRRGMSPEDPDAPKSIKHALIEFFGIPDGNLSNLTARERTELARNIAFVATGSKANPCYAVVDMGEGQTPRRLPDTILSLGKSNKLRIPFVQGRFNMGGTGVLQFCGKLNLQLVISRRCPEVAAYEDDPMSEQWGVTVVRREDPREGMRNSTFRYLAPGGEVLHFEAASLPLLPDEDQDAYGVPLEWGTYLKLYEYDMQGLKTNVVFDLNYRLALLMPKVALPIRIYERRDYSGHSLQTNLAGLSVRLDEDSRSNLEDGFPTDHKLTVIGQPLRAYVYAFREGEAQNYKKNEGIIFTVHGQTHGTLSKSFFSRKAVGMGFLEDSILVIVNCDATNGRIREDTFMNSRDRLRHTEFRSEVERHLEQEISQHPGLRNLRQRRRLEATREQTAGNKPLAEALERILRKSPTFARLFVQGLRLPNPFSLVDVAVAPDTYEGVNFPTFFRLDHDFSRERPKRCPVNVRCRVEFKTDADNKYFGRDVDPGSFILLMDNAPYENYALNLWNGTAYLNMTPPSDGHPGVLCEMRVLVTDVSRPEPIENTFWVQMTAAQTKSPGGPGGRRPPSSAESGDDTKNEGHLALPPVTPVRRAEWETHLFDKYSALRVVSSGDEGYDFFVNMDNIYLLTEQKGDPAQVEVLNARWMYGMALIGLALLRDVDDVDAEPSEDDGGVFDEIAKVTRKVGPVILPMVAALSELAVEV